MFVTRKRALLVSTVFTLTGLAFAVWSAGNQSISPVSRGSHGNDITIETKAFGSPDAARTFFTHVVDDLRQDDQRVLAVLCPRQVPGAAELVLRRAGGLRETILIVADGERVHRISRVHPAWMQASDVHKPIVAAAGSLIR